MKGIVLINGLIGRDKKSNKTRIKAPPHLIKKMAKKKIKDNETAYRWGEIDFKDVENLFCVWWGADVKLKMCVNDFN